MRTVCSGFSRAVYICVLYILHDSLLINIIQRKGLESEYPCARVSREYDINDFHECSLDFLETSDFHQFSSKLPHTRAG